MLGGAGIASPFRIARSSFRGPAIPSVPPGAVAGSRPAGAPVDWASAAPVETPTETPTPTPTAAPGIDLSAHSNDDPASIWVVVNKLRTLNPVDYVPADLVSPDVRYVNRQPMRQATSDALVPMFAAASSEAGDEASVMGLSAGQLSRRARNHSPTAARMTVKIAIGTLSAPPSRSPASVATASPTSVPRRVARPHAPR